MQSGMGFHVESMGTDPAKPLKTMGTDPFACKAAWVFMDLTGSGNFGTICGHKESLHSCEKEKNREIDKKGLYRGVG